jgi:hypothetical protein
MSILCSLRFYRLIVDYVRSFYTAYFEVANRKYFLSDHDTYDDGLRYVPEDAIYVEEWNRNGEMRRRVLYEGEVITEYDGDPFRPFKTPWIWIGDRTTGVDLTEAVSRYLMPDNVIALDLLFRFIRCNADTNLVYIDARTLEEVKFPNEGVRIEANGFA